MASVESKSFPTSSPSSLPPPSAHFVGRREDIVRAGRVTKLLNGSRDVLILSHHGDIHAMDLRCYHAGGLLQHGDIEEFDGRQCIVCPWHKYKITLAEGEGLYRAVDPSETPPRPRWRSKGVKQRVHKVTEVDGDMFVALDVMEDAVESDLYQTEKYRTAPLKFQAKT